MEKVAFQKGKRNREELYLPSLRYIVADDWIDKLGTKAFCAWIKFHSWVDRQNEHREYDKVPYTLEDVAKKLGMAKSTLYRTIIRPLWEYYLIDLVEYEGSKRKTQKPINIIVYESPMNRHDTEIKPLEKLRDWEKDYGSAPQIFGRKGGRPKKEEATDEPNRFKNETVYRFKNKTVTVSIMKPNNYSNKRLILSNKPNNVSNNHHLKPVDDDANANSTPWETDQQYQLFNQAYINVGADPILDHPKHYPTYKKVVDKVGFGLLYAANELYLSEKGRNAQIVYFLSGKYNEYITKLTDSKPKSAKLQDNKSNLPQSIEKQPEQEQSKQQPYSEEEIARRKELFREKLKMLNEMVETKNPSYL